MKLALACLLAGCGAALAQEDPVDFPESFSDPVEELKTVPVSDTQRVVLVQGEVLADQERQIAQTESDLIFALKSLDWLSCRQGAEARKTSLAACGPEPVAPAPIPIESPHVYLAGKPPEHTESEATAAEETPEPAKDPTQQQPTKD